MMTQPPNCEDLDQKTKFETLVKYVAMVGPAFIDKYYKTSGKKEGRRPIFR